MNSKRLANLLLLGSVMKSRNLVSIGLVVLFFLVYILAGGTVTLTPTKLKPSDSSFGAAGVGSVGADYGTFSGDVDVARPKPDSPVVQPDAGSVATEAEIDKSYESDAMANIRERLKNLNRREDAK